MQVDGAHMNVLFHLCIGRITEENYWAEYSIGLFNSNEEVGNVIKRLMSDGGPFSEPNCEARISEIEVVGEGVNMECVHRFYGQNIDSSLEGDLIESAYYADKSTAIQELMNAKKNTPRQQWHLETCKVGQCNW